MKRLSALQKKIPEIVKIALINLVFLAIFIELGAAALYWSKYKQLFYTRNENQTNEAIAQLGLPLSQTATDETVLERLHPFFGYVLKPNLPLNLEFSTRVFTVNNLGFPADYDYPFIRQNPNQVIIGVFGGSVASNFSMYEIENQVLAKTLKEKIPELANKEIIILPFALGGYKQPQQLLILNYILSLGQEFDFVINIDGFNEVALSNLNYQENIALSMPSVQHLLPLRDVASNNLGVDELSAIAKIIENREQLQEKQETLQQSKLASTYLFRMVSTQAAAKNYQENLMEFEKIRGQKQQNPAQDFILRIENAREAVDVDTAFSRMAELWGNSSRLMKESLEKQNSLYFHFIQPNQYYPTGRSFSEEERKLAIIDNHPYELGVQKGYPMLFQTLEQLKTENIPVFNATQIFDNVNDIVYIDSCCHYNKAGNQVFATYIADSIVGFINQNADVKKRWE
ncbi:hypothetical protein NG796_08265 [Laspinema sp. A4]|uniref:hypothetical protein n=1 Tax=Laspinema sp. D2d TaxID=2953686 RepID=UPI0021BB86D8|nr:hypothetical protein [Laspinema sp. D2d]MCT7983285.1 hypothetical protein [Laspinema sp. D2d]